MMSTHSNETDLRSGDPWMREARANATAAIRNLYRLLGDEEDALEQALGEITPVAMERAGEPVVIAVESIGVVDLVTLREYIESFVEDWEIGLDNAREILRAAPRPFVYNQDDALLAPESLQLHRALDHPALSAEIAKFEREWVDETDSEPPGPGPAKGANSSDPAAY
jgi:hypothetical protein